MIRKTDSPDKSLISFKMDSNRFNQEEEELHGRYYTGVSILIRIFQ